MSSIGATGPVVITPSVLSASLIDDLNADQSSMATVENQISTGNAINVASDDPAGAANLLNLQASVTRANQYSANAANGLSWLQLGNSTVSSVLSVLQQVQSLVESVSGNTLSSNPSAISVIATQVQGSLNQLINLANTQFAGQAIFAGTGGTTAAYDSNGNYLGSGSAPTRTVAPGTQVPVSATGPEIFGSGTSGLLSSTPGNLGVLAQIVQDLTTSTPSSIQNVETNDLTNLTNAISTVETAAANLGSNQQSVEGFSTQATNSVAALQGELSSVQNVNMAQAITSLQAQQTGYQAALYATSQISADSLVKYL